MSSWELTLPPERPQRDPTTGRFLPGSTPFNKGMKWDDYMDGRKQRKVRRIALENLAKHRPKKRPDTAGRCRRPVIAVMDDGTWHWFGAIVLAADWCGGSGPNIRRCIKDNLSGRILRKPWGKPTGKTNTDHKYMGVRWYYESDDLWTTKIKQQ
jgi:hypothetical protein